MVNKLNESYGISSSLRKALEADWKEFIKELDERVESGESFNVTVGGLINMFSKDFGDNVYWQMYDEPHDDFFRAVRSVPVEDIMKYYRSHQREFDGEEAVYAVSCAVQKKFAMQHINELEKFVEEFNFITDSNKEIKNRPNYESLRRKRNRK